MSNPMMERKGHSSALCRAFRHSSPWAAARSRSLVISRPSQRDSVAVVVVVLLLLHDMRFCNLSMADSWFSSTTGVPRPAAPPGGATSWGGHVAVVMSPPPHVTRRR